jgi:hypothetical protein
MRTSNGWAAAVACLLACLAVWGCADVNIHGPDWRWDGDGFVPPDTRASAEAPFDFQQPAGGVLSLRAIAGAVEIVGATDAHEIHIRGTRRVRSGSHADALQRLEDLQVQVSRSGETVLVETRQPKRSDGRSYEVDYRITVPATSDLVLDYVAGALTVRSVEGNVHAAGVSGGATLTDVEGNVGVALASGDITARLTVPLDGSVDLANAAGNISLEIPRTTSAALSAESLTGAVQILNLDLHDLDPRARVVRGTLADGRGRIDLRSTAGSITVRGR